MQTNDAIILHQKMRYLDPTAICEIRHAARSKCKDNNDMLVAPTSICEIRHDAPSKWKDNDDMLADCETPDENKEKRMSYHKDAMKKVAVSTPYMHHTILGKLCTIPYWVNLISIFCYYIHLLQSMAKNRISYFSKVTGLLL
jgi:hypothetical protein